MKIIKGGKIRCYPRLRRGWKEEGNVCDCKRATQVILTVMEMFFLCLDCISIIIMAVILYNSFARHYH